MTTIAIDGVSIAADGRRSWGSEVMSDDTAKIMLSDDRGHLFACAGTGAMFPWLIDWYANQDADPSKVPKCGDGLDWDLIVIGNRGVEVFNQKCPYAIMIPFPLRRPLAFGAGGDYAIGAMLAGASARRAVELVAFLCPGHTGGLITEVAFADIRGVKANSSIRSAAS